MAKFKGVERPCEVCGKIFRSPQSQAHVRSCSNECGYKLRAAANRGSWVILQCECCKAEFEERSCHAERRRFCSDSCKFSSLKYKNEQSLRTKLEGNPNWKDGASRLVVSASGVEYFRSGPVIERIRSSKRRAAKLQATPKWASESLILAMYEECQLKSEETGILHHVDHIVPLISDIVCGLHSEDNLQILPALDNLSKGNRHWPDMP